MCLLLTIPIIISPSVSSAWFFSSASAQENGAIPVVETVKPSELMVASIAMAQTTRPDHGIDIVITDKDSLLADIGALGTLADLVDIPTNDTISTYTVVENDTLSSIAERFNVSQNTIRWANNLSVKSTLKVGQKLTILPITGVRHTVVRGDTIKGIASKYKADAQEIANYNGIDVSDGLKIGTIILVPDGEITAVVQTSSVAKITGTGVTSSVSATKGYYTRPIALNGNPRIRKTQGFHDRYNAIDVGAPVGTSILAMADGTVITTRSVNAWNGGYGGLTIIQHANGSQTLYAHQSKILVSEGQKVKQGQKIGEVGSTGRSTGPHLHYEIRGIRPTPVLY